MALSKRSIATLIDLVEIKLSCLQVFDRDDARELATLESCRRELHAYARTQGYQGAVVPLRPTQTDTAGEPIVPPIASQS
jgi:hypothetical protein